MSLFKLQKKPSSGDEQGGNVAPPPPVRGKWCDIFQATGIGHRCQIFLIQLLRLFTRDTSFKAVMEPPNASFFPWPWPGEERSFSPSRNHWHAHRLFDRKKTHHFPLRYNALHGHMGSIFPAGQVVLAFPTWGYFRCGKRVSPSIYAWVSFNGSYGTVQLRGRPSTGTVVKKMSPVSHPFPSHPLVIERRTRRGNW
jgi:hypothetical protein